MLRCFSAAWAHNDFRKKTKVTVREMTSPDKISGRQLARHLHGEGGVDALVRDAGNAESAKLAVAIREYYDGLVEKSRRLRAVFTSLDAEENVFSKNDADQFYSPEAVETLEDEDRWFDDGAENEERARNDYEEEEEPDFEEDSDEESFDNDDDAEDRYGERAARKGDLLELLKSEHRVIVSGEPGGGKTTCLTYFTLKFAECEGECPVLAVFIPMGQWRRGGSLSLMVEFVTGLDTGQIARLMEENRLRLVIDAVNECPDEFRAAAIQNIGMFLADHPNVPAVISTRHPKELSPLQLPVFHVQPMDEAHRLRYLERYLADGEQARKLLRQLGGMPGGKTVAENPMLLRLVVEVYKESPEKRLPDGRAGLYRRSLRAWYKREDEKAEKAGTKLRWDRRQTFELLATLAFKSRQRGYRDVPLDEILAIWGDDAENQLEALCQGPIIYCDDEFVRFRHETFQEYLCAEYLVAHQGELPAWTQGDYARWGMPFAYAVELLESDKQQLPESFWLAAWSLNPWLGVALTDERKGRQLLSPHYQGMRPLIDGLPLDIQLKAAYLRAVCGTLHTRGLRIALSDERHPWYARGDVALRYVVFVSKTCQARWERFEETQLSCLDGLWIKQAVKLSRNWLTLNDPRIIFKRHAPEDWEGWIEDATPCQAERLVDSRIAVPEDFRNHKRRWTGAINLTTALRLVSKHIFGVSDIEEFLPDLLRDAEIKDVAGLAAVGLRGNPLIEEKIQAWISTATPNTASELISSGLATKAAFESKTEWFNGKSIPSAVFLVRSGLATNEDFKGESRKWASAATPLMAANLIAAGLMSPSDFSCRLSGWLQDPQYSFVRRYLRVSRAMESIRKNEMLIRRWIENASIQSASLLIVDGLATKEDFKGKVQEWCEFFTTRKKLLRMRLIDEEPCPDPSKGVRAAVEQACRDIKRGIKSPLDFSSEANGWIKAGDPTALAQMMQGGIVTLEMLGDKIKQCIDSSTPESAMRLIAKRLAKAGDFSHRVPSWKTFLSPGTALELIRHNVIQVSDVDDMKELWRNNVSASTIGHLRELNFLSLPEAIDLAATWGGDVAEKYAEFARVMKAVMEGVVSVDDVKKGIVEGLSEGAALIRLSEGVVATLRFEDISWGHVKHPDRLLEIGQEVEVKVIGVDLDKARIWVGIKQLIPDPWDQVKERFPIGTHVKGRVKSLAPFGVFVELAPDLVGLLHVSEMSWGRKIERADEVLNVGDEVEAVVLSIDWEKRLLPLSMRQALPNPWVAFRDRHPIGSRVKGLVCKVRSFGAFVELQDGIQGMIHVSNLSWAQSVADPSECLQVGQEVETVVLSVDVEQRHLGLGLKQTQPNPCPEAIAKYSPGMVVTGRVLRLTPLWALVELEPGVDGVIHVSEVADKEIGNVKDLFNVGDEITAQVIAIDRVACRITLSTIRSYPRCPS